MSPPLADRVALVTGASRGIGYATALALAKAGAHIVALARTVGGLEELDDAIKAAGGSATLVPLDLKDYAGIDRLGIALRERFGRLDVLVGNAGILGPLSPLGHVDAKTWDEVMAVNVTANWRLICAMDPLLRLSDAGRAVFVSSGVAALALAYWGPYAVSKAALETLARTYAAETATTNVRINLFTPGPIRTRMRAQAFPGEDPMTLETPDKVADSIVRLCLPSMQESGKLYAYRGRQVPAVPRPGLRCARPASTEHEPARSSVPGSHNDRRGFAGRPFRAGWPPDPRSARQSTQHRSILISSPLHDTALPKGAVS